MAEGINTPVGPNWVGWLHTGIGAVVMAVLMTVQHRYLWWPFHPLGYPISCVFAGMWFSMFLGWVLKSVVPGILFIPPILESRQGAPICYFSTGLVGLGDNGARG